MTCDIQSCPRNILGKCELSIIYDKGHEFYSEPKICTHYKFIKRKRKQ